MRLFISINLPEECNEKLRAVQARLVEDWCGGAGGGCSAGGGRGAELSLAGRKGGFHLTLVFLGEVSAEVAMWLQAELRKVAFAPFELELAGGLGAFVDRRGFAKVVFALVDEGSSGYAALLDLQKKVAEAVGRFGFVTDKPFAAHVTLARVKRSPVGFADAVRELRVGSATEKKNFMASAFYLMESELGSGGAEYREICGIGACE